MRSCLQSQKSMQWKAALHNVNYSSVWTLKLALTLSVGVAFASGSTFPYTGRHQQLHWLALLTKWEYPAKTPKRSRTITVGRSLHKFNIGTHTKFITCMQILCNKSTTWLPWLPHCTYHAIRYTIVVTTGCQTRSERRSRLLLWLKINNIVHFCLIWIPCI